MHEKPVARGIHTWQNNLAKCEKKNPNEEKDQCHQCHSDFDHNIEKLFSKLL